MMKEVGGEACNARRSINSEDHLWQDRVPLSELRGIIKSSHKPSLEFLVHTLGSSVGLSVVRGGSQMFDSH
jgi:hypothetical protein